MIVGNPCRCCGYICGSANSSCFRHFVAITLLPPTFYAKADLAAEHNSVWKCSRTRHRGQAKASGSYDIMWQIRLRLAMTSFPGYSTHPKISTCRGTIRSRWSQQWPFNALIRVIGFYLLISRVDNTWGLIGHPHSIESNGLKMVAVIRKRAFLFLHPVAYNSRGVPSAFAQPETASQWRKVSKQMFI